MDHLTRYQPLPLTERTITNPHALFEALDGHGPYAAQFDLLEYSHEEVCAAFPLGIPGQAPCVALSLPAGQRHQLLHTAHKLSERSAGLLLALLLTNETPTNHRPPRTNTHTTRETHQPALTNTARALPQIHATRH
ncbi:hypothetical protein HEK616_36470 [Streptomyces nigrescens]|uniref:Uncharacterized protein n=1 Tax=Streptomyces nigrescens TaxID=1920 RepID=A0ABN6QZA4_STRNI|nr:hypothetical protein HEK616_36470 [Streptomyces nigrescens]